MKIHIVTTMVGGYAKEDPDIVSVVGAYTDDSIARKLKIALQGEIHTVEVDVIHPGHQAIMKELWKDKS